MRTAPASPLTICDAQMFNKRLQNHHFIYLPVIFLFSLTIITSTKEVDLLPGYYSPLDEGEGDDQIGSAASGNDFGSDAPGNDFGSDTPGNDFGSDAAGNGSAAAGNEFSEEIGIECSKKKYAGGCLKIDPIMERAYATTPPNGSFRADFPIHFDAQEKWPECSDVIGKIWNQGGCGNCWAVASVSSMSDRICIASKGQIKVILSAREVTGCVIGDGCEGSNPYFAFLYWIGQGIVTGSVDVDEKEGCQLYPFEQYCAAATPKCFRKCLKQDFTIPRVPFANAVTKYYLDKKWGISTKWLRNANEETIMNEIMINGPIVAGMESYPSLELHKQDVIYEVLIGEKTKGLHAVKIYGWGQTEPEDGGPPVKFWKVANSWGNEWGNRGTFKIKKGVDESGIEKTGIWFGKPRV